MSILGVVYLTCHYRVLSILRLLKMCTQQKLSLAARWKFAIGGSMSSPLNEVFMTWMSRTAIPVLKAFSWAFCITCPFLTIVATHNCSSRRKREVNLYFCFPFEFHRFCKTWQLYGIIEMVFCMSSECAHQSNSSKKLLKLFFLRNPSSSLWR